jgi:uncharacterized protein YfaT (DUF1175 family)
MMNVCIVQTACPTQLTLTSQQLDAVEKPWCRLTREAILIAAAVVCVGVCMAAVDRNVMEGIPGSSVNAN